MTEHIIAEEHVTILFTQLGRREVFRDFLLTLKLQTEILIVGV